MTCIMYAKDARPRRGHNADLACLLADAPAVILGPRSGVLGMLMADCWDGLHER